MTKAYLLGALHDGTVRRLTYRIGQKDQKYIKFLVKGIKASGQNAWMYDIIDEKTRFVLATRITYTRTTHDAEMLMERAEKRAGKG